MIDWPSLIVGAAFGYCAHLLWPRQWFKPKADSPPINSSESHEAMRQAWRMSKATLPEMMALNASSMADACTALKAEQETEIAAEAAVIGGHASDCKVALMVAPLRPHAWLECTCGALVRPANVVRVTSYARRKAAPRQKGAPK